MATKHRAKPRAKVRAKQSLPAGYRRWDAANYLKSEQDMAAIWKRQWKKRQMTRLI